MADPSPAPNPFDPTGVSWSRVSPRLRTARLIVTTSVCAIPAACLAVTALATGLVWVWALVAIPVVLWAWCAIVIPRQVRALGYAERHDDLLIRKGVLFRSLVVVPYGRMQYVDVQAGPLARSLRIASVQLHTASSGTDASIPGLESSEAERLRDQLASRGESRLAGL